MVARRPGRRPAGTPTLLGGAAGAAGALGLLATSLYFVAAVSGLLTVAAALASLYPAVTVAPAAAFLHERPDRRQVTGLVLDGIAVAFTVAS